MNLALLSSFLESKVVLMIMKSTELKLYKVDLSEFRSKLKDIELGDFNSQILNYLTELIEY